MRGCKREDDQTTLQVSPKAQKNKVKSRKILRNKVGRSMNEMRESDRSLREHYVMDQAK